MALVPAVNQTTTDSAFWFLLTLTSASGDVSRFVNNLEDVISRGDTYLAYPFEVTLAADDLDTRPQLALRIDNVDQAIIGHIRQSLAPPVATLELVLSASPDTVEMSIGYLRLMNVTYDAQSITGVLTPHDILDLPAVDSVYTGVEFPDLAYA